MSEVYLLKAGQCLLNKAAGRCSVCDSLDRGCPSDAAGGGAQKYLRGQPARLAAAPSFWQLLLEHATAKWLAIMLSARTFSLQPTGLCNTWLAAAC